MLSGGLPAGPRKQRSPPSPQSCSAHPSPPKLQRRKPASQSRLPRRLLSPFQCNRVPRRCSLSCSCDLHFFSPQLCDLTRGCFPAQVFQAEHPTGLASHRQHQPCSFHLSVRVSSQTKLHNSAGWLFPPLLHLHHPAHRTPSAGMGQKQETTRDQETQGGGWPKTVFPPKIPRPLQLCRGGEHQFITIRALLHPARRVTTTIPLGSLLVRHIVRNATLIFAEY